MRQVLTSYLQSTPIIVISFAKHKILELGYVKMNFIRTKPIIYFALFKFSFTYKWIKQVPKYTQGYHRLDGKIHTDAFIQIIDVNK